MKTIYLVRHSNQYKNIVFNNCSVDDYVKNLLIPLSHEGEENASLMATKYFKNVKYLYSSEYSRALNTAKYISENNNLKINIFSNFNERKLGDTSGIKEEFWLEQLKDENAKTLNGESQKEVRNRMLKGVNIVLKQMNDDEFGVIVSHASSITYLLMNWCELVDATLKDKKRHLKYKNKTIINDSFNAPDIFELTFSTDNKIMGIRRIEEGDC